MRNMERQGEVDGQKGVQGRRKECIMKEAVGNCANTQEEKRNRKLTRQ